MNRNLYIYIQEIGHLAVAFDAQMCIRLLQRNDGVKFCLGFPNDLYFLVERSKCLW